MKRITCLGIFILSIFSILFSQSNTVSSGGDASSASGSVSFSVGQVDYISASGTEGHVNQGVQQPIEIFVYTGTNEEIQLISSVYPNPVSTTLNLNIKGSDFSGYKYALLNVAGIVLLEMNVSSEQSTIDMTHFSSGNYLLKVNRNQKELKTFKIIKH